MDIVPLAVAALAHNIDNGTLVLLLLLVLLPIIINISSVSSQYQKSMWKLALIKVRFGSHTSYQDQILGKIIDGVPAKYTQCGSSSPRPMYARSKPESWDSKNNYNNSSHKKGLREEWLTTSEASKTDIAAFAVVGGPNKRPNKRTLLALGALVWIVGVSYDLAHAIEGEGLLLCASRKE